MKYFVVFFGVIFILLKLTKCLEEYDSKRKSGGFQGQSFSNVSSTIEKLLKNYDIRLRPRFGVGTLNVSMEVRIASFDGISEVNMDYTLTIYLNQYWNDERLVFGNSRDYLTLMGDFAEKIWVPDTFFANDKYAYLHDVTEKNKMIKIFGNGDIIYGMRFTTTLACMMDLHNYPLDSQNCTIEIESYGYTSDEVNICWKNSKVSVSGVDKVHLPQFKILDYKTSTYVEYLATGQYARLSLSFLLQRNIGYFIFQTYLPSILIVILSWVSFWINHEATSARVSLGITTVLTMTTISTGVRSSLPRISYVKAIDIYLLTCFIFVFAALLEYAAVNYNYWSQRAKKRKRMNQTINENLVNCFETNEKTLTNDRPKQNEVEEETDNRASPLPWLYNYNNTNIDDIDMENETRSPLANDEIYSEHTLPTIKRMPVASSSTYSIRSNNLIKKRSNNNATKRPVIFTGNKKGIRANNRQDILYKSNNLNNSIQSNTTFNPPDEFENSIRLENMQRMNKKHIWNTLRYKAKRIMPILKDINIIDKYSRIIFPSLFLLFNVCYWCFYFVQSTYIYNIENNLH